MKKMLRIAAALAALLAMTNFIGCKNDDDDESGNGLENTYWVMGDISTDVVENVSLTLKNGTYVHIEDSSKGSVYGADIENLDYSTLDFTKTNSVDISYSSEKQSFTYVVDGSKITVTSKYTDEDGKEQTETFEGTLAADKKSFTTKYTDDDGKEVSETYTRIDKAPAKATLVITVTGSDVDVTEVKITSTVTEVTAGEIITLTAAVSPENATNKTVTWTSSNESVATVDSTGKVTGVAAGTATITAKAGEKTATVDVTVKAAATSGGETGGETGTTTEFENTYWVLEEKVSEFSGMKVTLQNFIYVYINDSTSGLVYMPDTDTAVEELANTGGGKRTVAYGEVTGNAFTYTVEGKNIILTATIEGKTETLTGTIVDENTLRFTDNADVDPFEFTLKKAAVAPTEATVTVEITAAPSTKVLDVVYDLTTGLPTDFPTAADTLISADWDAPVATPATNDITWTWIATSTRKVKNNTGLQVSNGSSAEDMITLSADSDFTVTVTYKFAGAYAADKVRCITVGDKSDSMASDTDRTKEYTLTTTAAKTATIAMNGMKLLKVETKAAN